MCGRGSIRSRGRFLSRGPRPALADRLPRKEVQRACHGCRLVQKISQSVQSRKFKPRVLVILGWNDPRIIQGIGQYAREAGWRLEVRQFYTETFPSRWDGDGLIVSNTERADLRAFMRHQVPLQPTVLVGGNNPGLHAPRVTEDNCAAGAAFPGAGP